MIKSGSIYASGHCKVIGCTACLSPWPLRTCVGARVRLPPWIWQPSLQVCQFEMDVRVLIDGGE